MRFSLEMDLLIESMSVVVLKTPIDRFRQLIKRSDVDWPRLEKLVKYHSIRPMLSEACNLAGFDNASVEEWASFTRLQSIHNMAYGKEAIRILKIMEAQKIIVLPLKGLVFLDKIYEGRPLREMGDFDILVSKAESVRALKILLAEGYRLKVDEVINDKLLTDIIEKTPNHEVGLFKETKMGIMIHIDFHWKVYEAPQYNFETEEILSGTQIANFQGETCLMPNSEILFKMLLNHHGGRDCWLKLKHVADLLIFLVKQKELSREELNDLGRSMGMEQINKLGVALVDLIFLKKEDAYINPHLLNQIVHFWENGKDIKSIYPKILRLRIYRKVQDHPTSWRKLLWQELEFHSKATPVESKRLMVFSERHVVLNSLMKLLSYLNRYYIKRNLRKIYTPN